MADSASLTDASEPSPRGIGKRRLLIKAALMGATVPVVTTFSRPAFAACTGTTSWVNSKCS